MSFPEIMIVRYYESGIIDITYSDNGSKENKNLIEERLERQQEEDKHLETYGIFYKGENICSEEER
ncbi:MAG: hypothetical protein Q9M94_00200 [Candidatus Gracilibacteria bacterium]|nr:hypothetical protein [Candidatus Gracilibacteria bacterium]